MINSNLKANLTDKYNRKIDYIRLSVTDRCDLRCNYCLPKDFKNYQHDKSWLNFDEIEKLINAWVNLGVRRIRLTGGEPLLRRNLPELVKRLSQIPNIEDLALSTNATQLSRFADELYHAGLHRLNISLDSLKPECHHQITGKNNLSQVLNGIDTAQKVGFKRIKINMVVQTNFNEQEIDQMIKFCAERHLILRLIETMPIGHAEISKNFSNLNYIRNRLVEKYQLIPLVTELGGGPARYWESLDQSIQIGFITPLSQHFCQTCNRVRIGVDGKLYLCLGDEHAISLKDYIHQSDEVLKQALIDAINLKPERHEFIENPKKIIRFMSQTGG